MEEEILKEARALEAALRANHASLSSLPVFHSASSLSQVLAEWNVRDKERLADTLQAIPCTCLLAALEQDGNHVQFVFENILSLGLIARCEHILDAAIHNTIFEGRFQSSALSRMLSMTMLHAMRERDGASRGCVATMSCALARLLTLDEGGHDNFDSSRARNNTVLDIFQTGLGIASEKATRSGLERPSLPLEPLQRLMVLYYLTFIIREKQQEEEASMASLHSQTNLATRYLDMTEHMTVTSAADVEHMRESLHRLDRIFLGIPPRNNDLPSHSKQQHSKQQDTNNMNIVAPQRDGLTTQSSPWRTHLDTLIENLAERVDKSSKSCAPSTMDRFLCSSDVHDVLLRYGIGALGMCLLSGFRVFFGSMGFCALRMCMILYSGANEKICYVSLKLMSCIHQRDTLLCTWDVHDILLRYGMEHLVCVS
jgi:hypothetical protein